jgi:hypothetical protein
MPALLMAGCSLTKKTPIVTIGETHLYKHDFLYEIYLVETEGNQLENYYQKHLGCGYWDYKYDGSTMRELAKSSVLASVVMHQILYDQAVKKGMKLTSSEIAANKTAASDIQKDSSKEKLDRVGLTRTLIINSLNKITLADKYKARLCKNIKINEASIRSKINRSDYSSDNQYEKAVCDAITTEKDRLFEPIYKRIKSNYDISINFDYWDTITIGSITEPK